MATGRAASSHGQDGFAGSGAAATSGRAVVGVAGMARTPARSAVVAASRAVLDAVLGRVGVNLGPGRGHRHGRRRGDGGGYHKGGHVAPAESQVHSRYRCRRMAGDLIGTPPVPRSVPWIRTVRARRAAQVSPPAVALGQRRRGPIEPIARVAKAREDEPVVVEAFIHRGDHHLDVRGLGCHGARPSGAAIRANAITAPAPRDDTRLQANVSDPPVASIGSHTTTVRPSSSVGTVSQYTAAVSVRSSLRRPRGAASPVAMVLSTASSMPSPARRMGTTRGPGSTRRGAGRLAHRRPDQPLGRGEVTARLVRQERGHLRHKRAELRLIGRLVPDAAQAVGDKGMVEDEEAHQGPWSAERRELPSRRAACATTDERP